MATSPTHRCVMCEKPLLPGQFFPLPTEYPELKRWGLGLFPSRPDEFSLFIEHVRLQTNNDVPSLCPDHFSRKDYINERGTLRLFSIYVIPKKYEGSMRIRMEKTLWQRRKCVVCGALRPSDEMYPFTQKNQLVLIWCENIHSNDAKTASKLLNKVMKAVSPTLCGEHFSESCFNNANDLKPNSIPTMADVCTTASVMSILSKAKADLQRVLPGNFIPRDDTWAKVEEEGSSKDQCKQKPNRAPTSPGRIVSKRLPPGPSVELNVNPCLVKNEQDQGMEEDSLVLFDNSQSDSIKKEEEIEQLGEMVDEWDDVGSSTSLEQLEHPPIKRSQRKRNGKSTEDYSPMRRSSRASKACSPKLSLRRTRATPVAPVAEEPEVTTRSGRTVKRKADYDEPARKQRPKRPMKDPALSEARSINPIMELIFPDRKSGGAKRAAAAATPSSSAAGRILPVKGTPAYEASTMRNQAPKNTRIRPIINKLKVERIKCSLCRATAETTIFGMKEHAREHCDHSLKCPFDDCPINFSANKRSKVSYHTQTVHRKWSFPIDLCDRDSALEKQIEKMMQTCFPTAMNRANEPGSVPCSICSMVVSPEYRSLYSHACLHLPSRPYGCSECPTFEAYTEEEIEEHHRQEKCNGDIMSNMDDAITSLAEKLFKTAFPSFVHLLEDRCPIDIAPQPLPITTQQHPTLTEKRLRALAPLGLEDRKSENEEEDEHKLEDFPDFIRPEEVNIVAMNYANSRLAKIEENKEVTLMEHDHTYCATL